MARKPENRASENRTPEEFPWETDEARLTIQNVARECLADSMRVLAEADAVLRAARFLPRAVTQVKAED